MLEKHLLGKHRLKLLLKFSVEVELQKGYYSMS